VLKLFSIAVLTAALFTAHDSPATTLTFTDSASFLAALPGSPTTETFEGVSAGDPVGTLGNITYSESVPGESLIGTDFYSATSGSIMLGLDNFDEAFLDGDVLTLTFASPVQALGFFVVTSDAALASEVLLTTAAGTAPNSDTEEAILGDGGLAYFVGLVSDTSFSSATLEFADDGEVNFVYNVDDVITAVPEPGTLALLAAGLLVMSSGNRRRR
jgi:hypothetical protein